MEITKKETLRFSQAEIRALILVVDTMNGIAKQAENPTLREKAKLAATTLNEIFVEYGSDS